MCAAHLRRRRSLQLQRERERERSAVLRSCAMNTSSGVPLSIIVQRFSASADDCGDGCGDVGDVLGLVMVVATTAIVMI